MTVGPPEVRVGLVGTGWIVRAHAHALHTVGHIQPPPYKIRVVAVTGRNRQKVEALAAEVGAERWTTDWQRLVQDPEVDVVANLATNALHAPVSLAAIEAGKAVLCEKPLATTLDEGSAMAFAADRTRTVAACGFNYRFVPALRLLHQLLHQGRLGTVRHYRGQYLQDWRSGNPDWPNHSGAGSVEDYSHLFDMVLHLVGEPVSVSGQLATFFGPSDDAFLANLDLPDGGTVSLQASRCATGWKGRHRVEIEGSEGSAWWDMEDLNRLHVYFADDQPDGLAGYRDLLITEAGHPFMSSWWPAGHVIGWEHTFVHQWRAFLDAVRGGEGDPLRADFTDGLRALELADAVRRSARDGQRVAVALTKRHEAHLAGGANLVSASATREAVDRLASLNSTDRRLR